MKIKIEAKWGVFFVKLNVYFYISTKETWIVIIMRHLKSLGMKLSLFILIMEEGKIPCRSKDILYCFQCSYYNIFFIYCFLEALLYECHFFLISVSLFSFGKHSHDELSILVPLSQCCRSVLALLTLYYYSVFVASLHESAYNFGGKIAIFIKRHFALSMFELYR